MPVSMTTFLLLWSALLLSGTKAEPSKAALVNPAHCQSIPAFLELGITTTIRSWPLEQPGPWGISEADTAEEVFGEDDAKAIASASGWISPCLTEAGRLSAARLDRGIVPSSFRSPILRC